MKPRRRPHHRPQTDPLVVVIAAQTRLIGAMFRWMKRQAAQPPVDVPPVVRFDYEVEIAGLDSQGASMPLEIKLTTEQRVLIKANPKTPKGKAAQIDGKISFTSDNEGVVITQVDDNSAYLSVPNTIGDATVIVSADADLGEGVTTIQDAVILHVSDPQASSLGLSAGDPEPTPDTE